MARKEVGKAGRAEITLDWELIDDSLIAGCLGTEVAAALGIYEDTLYRRVQSDKGMTFSDYAAKMRAKGDRLLRKAQQKNALNGNTTMQIWLGKQRLGQREDPRTNEFTQEDRARLEKMSNAIEAGISRAQQQPTPKADPLD